VLRNIVTHPAYAALRQYRQFIVYELVWNPAKNKNDKFPIHPTTLMRHDAHNSAIWLDASSAAAIAEAYGERYGVGFVFTAADPFFFVDIDSALVAGQWSPRAQELCTLFNGALMEVSQSRTGMHIIGAGQCSEHGKVNSAERLEFYTELRFCALTGSSCVGDAATRHDAALAHITQYLFPPPLELRDGEWTTAPREDWRGPTDDDELIRWARKSQSARAAFGNGASFADLFDGNAEALARAFPPNSPDQPYNASQADAALASHLMFWTGHDCERVERIMRKSALKRDKWDERDDYLRNRTIMGAFRSHNGEVLQAEPTAPSGAVPTLERGGMVSGNTFLSPEEQLKVHFKGCIYIADQHRILTPQGRLYKPDQFRAMYGGFTFAMDTINQRTSRNAWEAFTENQAYRCDRADNVSFEPLRPPGEMHQVGPKILANSYVPIETPQREGDPTLFRQHLARLLPAERDQAILLSYMAACVQHVGHKFKWAPFIQGVPGNGKTVLSQCLAEAIGPRYTYWPKASGLAGRFNGWLVGKLLYCIEDLYTADSLDQASILEDLKPLISGGTGIDIETKGVDQYNTKIYGNFMINSNFAQAVRKDGLDRRYAMMLTAQQRVGDILRDGMTGDYFKRLFDWLENKDGYAIVNHYLRSLPIPPQFNPAVTAGGLAHVAPSTTTESVAIEASRGRIEQEIVEAIKDDRPGFRGGWISSHMFNVLLQSLPNGGRLSPVRKREILQGLGYEWHPGLVEGRTNTIVMPDGQRTTLYVAPGHSTRAFREHGAIISAYEGVNR